jgi:DedD protein
MSSLPERDMEDSNEREITLSTGSVLGIFVGLVLICGVFFGFGYSMGRRAIPAIPAASATGTGEADGKVVNRRAKLATTVAPSETPVESSDTATGSTDAGHAPAALTLPIVENSEAAQPPVEAKPRRPSAAHVQEATEPARLETPSSSPHAETEKASDVSPGAGKTMVQVAAVSRQEDADVLVSALRQRGYGVLIRNEPQDKLLHVQVGPFANRADASNMRQKLLSDGYNAIVKP